MSDRPDAPPPPDAPMLGLPEDGVPRVLLVLDRHAPLGVRVITDGPANVLCLAAGTTVGVLVGDSHEAAGGAVRRALARRRVVAVIPESMLDDDDDDSAHAAGAEEPGTGSDADG